MVFALVELRDLRNEKIRSLNVFERESLGIVNDRLRNLSPSRHSISLGQPDSRDFRLIPPLAHATFQLFCRFLYFKVDHLPLNGQSSGQETGVKIVWNNPSPPLRSRFSCERVERDSRGARYRIVANDTAKTFEIIYFKVA